jgi:hypothetical protein
LVRALSPALWSPADRLPPGRPPAAMAGPREEGRERRAGERGCWAGPAGWADQKRREGERVGARVGRERERARIRLGQARGEGEMTRVADFCFSFSKI